MGIPTDIFTEEVPDNYICEICHDVLEDHIECENCTASFSEMCIELSKNLKSQRVSTAEKKILKPAKGSRVIR